MTSLELERSGLDGTLPTELGSPTSLTELELQNNDLTGSIPTELGSFTDLQQLDLSDNALTGSIPTALGGLTNLQRLSLSDNELTGSIPTELGSLPRLMMLNLQNNDLTGAIPTELGSLTNLTGLHLWYNNLTGSISVDLSTLNTLRPDYPENGVSPIVTVSASSLVPHSFSWSISGTDSEDFSISESGVLTFSSPPNYESPADAGRDNDYRVTVHASDGEITDMLDVGVHVTDMETIITLLVSPSSLSEGDGSATTVTVTATLDGDSTLGSDTTVTLSLSGTAAGSGTDYTAGSLPTVTIPAGASIGTGELSITPVNDAVVEGAETIVVEGTATELTVSSDTITLEDDDAATLSVSGPSSAVSEGDDASFTVTLSHAIVSEVTVAWSATPDTATTDDYGTASGSVIFAAVSAAGATQSFTVPITDDLLSEGEESFSVSLGTISGDLSGQITLDSSASSVDVTIAESDPKGQGATGGSPQVAARIGNITLTEGGSSRSVGLSDKFSDPDGDELTYSAASSRTSVVRTRITGSTLTLTPVGPGTARITVTVRDPDGAEAQQSFTVRVSGTTPPPSGGGGSSNRRPVFDEGTSATRQVAENTAAGQDIGGRLAATDRDGDSLTYTLSGVDASSFQIDRSSGQLGTRVALDYEAQSSYRVTARVSDGRGRSDTISVTVTVTNVDEPGTVTLDSTQPLVGTVVTATLTDPDGTVSGESWQWASSSDQNTWTNITVATSASYTPVAADVDRHLRATVSYTDGEGPGKSAASPSTHTVRSAAPDGAAASMSFSRTTLRVSEGSAATYTVALDTELSAAVIVSLESSDVGAATVSPGSLTFTGTNWETPQTVTVRDVNDTSRSDERVTITHSASGGDYDGVSGTVTVNVGDTDSDDRVRIVPVPNAVVVLPDVETTITSLDGNATLTFPVDSRSAGFQVSMDASLDNCTTNNPPEGTVHACVSVEIFDAAGNREESAALDEAATLEFRLGPERVEELSGQEILREADEEGRLLLMTREGPDDVWREVQFVLFLTEEGGALLTISVREFSEFAVVLIPAAEPEVTPEPTATPEPTPEPSPTATATPEPTVTPPTPGATVQPTATRTPTASPTQATPTASALVPTLTPEPTATVTSGPSVEDEGANVGLIVLIVVLVAAAIAGRGGTNRNEKTKNPVGALRLGSAAVGPMRGV